ncbi:hypothetical protein C1646_765924 [Rhizophagus diaphanus]|nr:hypothetical protein C1646_765924 [Rhizophagus diaphanus] [Rhizophagus sp. MUCL 43196]
MKQYSKAIPYFTKANIIDPENIHNLNKRAIAYYIIQEYDKVLLDLDKIMQLDPLNSSAYAYLKSLTYYTKNDINNVTILFEKIFTKSKDLNKILTKINQIPNISENKLLLLIRCKMYIELKEYYKVDLNMLFAGECKRYYYKAFSYIHLLQTHSDFWSYLYEVCKFDKCDFTKLGIINEFSKYMYYEKGVYFISNLTNLNSELCQFQESDISSLSGLENNQNERLLKYEDVSKLEELGWIEYQNLVYNLYGFQLSIEINSIEMQIDYVRSVDEITRKITPIPNMSLMGYLLPDYHQFLPIAPETFKDKYFSRKEMEILLDLNDILSNL